MARIGLFGASGADSGSGIRNVMGLVRGKKLPSVDPIVLISCNPAGGIVRIAGDVGIAFDHFPRPSTGSDWRRLFERYELDFLVLLGCSILVVGMDDYTDRIVNEHPALLRFKDPAHPKKSLFGGKGMTDLNVHKAVIAARQTLGIDRSGTTTHFVCCGTGTADDYDAGGLFIGEHELFLAPDETPESLQSRVKKLQQQNTPYDVEAVASGRVRLERTGRIMRVVRE